MTHRPFQGAQKRIKKQEDLASTLAVRTSELRNEREQTRIFQERLDEAERTMHILRDQLAEARSGIAAEQSQSMERVNQELDALKRETAFWTRAVPDKEERIELASLLEWQLTVQGHIAGLTRSIGGRHELIGDLQELERRASLEGRQEDFDRLRERIETCYSDIKEFRREISDLRAIVATKIMPMIDRAMTGEYRLAAGPESAEYDDVEPTETVELTEVSPLPVSAKPIVAQSPLPIHQPLTALDRYELPLVFAGLKQSREIVELIRWLVSEDFVKRFSQCIILIEEDAFETRIAKIADLKKWRVEAQIRARKLVRYLLEELPIWVSNELASKQIELHVDREGKLQQFLAVLDLRFKERVAQRERLQDKPKPGIKPSEAVKQEEATPIHANDTSDVKQPRAKKAPSNGIHYSGKRVSLHRDLIGKESQLLEHVPLGHFFGDANIGGAYSRLKKDGYVSDLEQTLREARMKELTKRIEQQIVADGPAQGRSVNGIITNAERIEACVAKLTFFDDSNQLDKGKAVERAYDILTTQEGSNAYSVQRATRTKKIRDEAPPNPIRS